MATQINVIITPKMVYATYVKTICFRETLTEDDNQSRFAIMEAKSIAFNYGQYYGSCMLNAVEVEEDWNDQDVFDYLEKTNQ